MGSGKPAGHQSEQERVCTSPRSSYGSAWATGRAAAQLSHARCLRKAEWKDRGALHQPPAMCARGQCTAPPRAPPCATGWFAREQCPCRKMTFTVTLFCCPKLPLRVAEKAKRGVLFCSIFSLNCRTKVDVAVNAAMRFATEAFLCG